MQGLFIYFLIYKFRGYEIQINKDVCNIVYKKAAQCTQCIGPFGGRGSRRRKMFAETRGSVLRPKKNEEIGQATGLRDRNVCRDPRLSTWGKEK